MTAPRFRRRVVQPYLATAGRPELDPQAVARLAVDRHSQVYLHPDQPADGLDPPARRLVELLEPGPLSVYECAADLQLPYGVVQLLVVQLAALNVLLIRQPPSLADLPRIDVVERVLRGLQAAP